MTKKRTLSGLIRERLPDIEQKIFNGTRQSAIVEELENEGFEVSLENFRTLLYRARKKHDQLRIQNKILNEPRKEIKKIISKEIDVPISSNPADLDSIINTPPNLEELAKISRKKTK